MRRVPALFLFSVAAFVSSHIAYTPVFASWIRDGNVVIQKVNNQQSSVAIADGQGGVFVAWADERVSTLQSDIYVQRIDAEGNPMWNSNGVAVCTATGYQAAPSIATDAAGGIVVAWEDRRGGVALDIYAQRVNSAGVPQWASNGVAICVAANDQTDHGIASDGLGGAYLAWVDRRTDALGDVYAQRVNGSGARTMILHIL